MKPLRLTIWQIYATGGIACLAVTACAWFFLAAPALAGREEDRDLELAALERHREMPKLTAQLTVNRRQAAVIYSAIEKSNITLQPTSSLNERLALIEGLAAKCGVAVDEVHPGEPVAGSHYQSVPIKLTGTTGYVQCTEFLHRIHESLPDIGVKSMDMNAPTTSGKAGGSFHFELIWYAKK